jgi:cell division protein FtsW
VVPGAALLLVLVQAGHDLGTSLVLMALVGTVLFVAGAPLRLFLVSLGLAAIVTKVLVTGSDNRMGRISTWLDGCSGDGTGKAYLDACWQTVHGQWALASGGWWGVGLGASREKWGLLPEVHNDFIFAVIGEELGLVGVAIVVALFFWLVQRCFEVGRQAIALERTYAGLVAKGIGIWIGVQAFINMGVNLGLLPTKGLTLPLMSYGGSGILVNCVAFALVMRVDYENRVLMRGGRV